MFVAHVCFSFENDIAVDFAGQVLGASGRMVRINLFDADRRAILDVDIPSQFLHLLSCVDDQSFAITASTNLSDFAAQIPPVIPVSRLLLCDQFRLVYFASKSSRYL